MRDDERQASVHLQAAVREPAKWIAPAPIRSVEAEHPWLWIAYALAGLGALALWRIFQ
jgi:hypothetical protein